MLKIGITGGIGSGKTTVCHIFETLGIPVFYADEEAKKITNDGSEVAEQIKTVFGAHLYKNGMLDRKALGNIVFNNKEKLALLNSIIHPATVQRFDNWATSFKNKAYMLKEAAILFESGTDKGLDAVITVTAPLELRIERVMKRDQLSYEQVMERINNQMPDEEKIKRSNFVINNNEDDLVIPQVITIHKQLLQYKK